MKPTPIALLLAVAVACGVVVYGVVSLRYGELPDVPLYAPATVAFLGMAELFAAASVRARLHGRPGTRPVDRLAVARLVALAKASSYAGALAFGGYGALLAYVLQQLDNPHKSHDALASSFGIGAALLLAAAALVLERVLRLPKPPDDEPPSGGHDWDPFADWHRDHRGR